MKIRYFSDLHLEFLKTNQIERFIQQIPPGLDEICVLAGDIGNPYEPNYNIFIKFISKNFKKSFIIAGNHEYYNKKKNMTQIIEFLTTKFENFDNISFLNNNYEIYENHCFIGTTLWSQITKPHYEINDVYQIKDFNHIKYNRLNTLCVNFLNDAISMNPDMDFVIITHHVPSNDLIDIEYKTPMMAPYNQWFYCDLNDFIEKNKDKIKCWIYGHTHTPSTNLIHGVHMLCNPIGYPEQHSRADFSKTIEFL
jgi:predicted phosphohydrolase